MATIELIVGLPMAMELRQWVTDQQEYWPENTAFQKDLNRLAHQLDRAIKHFNGELVVEFGLQPKQMKESDNDPRR